MKALEARAKSMKAMNENQEFSTYLEKIYKEIEKAAENGRLKLTINVSYKYHDYVSTKLIEDGYDINIIFEGFEIKW